MFSYGGVAFTLADLVESVTSDLNTVYQLNRVQDFIKKHPNLGVATDAFKQATENIRTNIRWIETNKLKIHDWLVSNFVPSTTHSTSHFTVTSF